MAGQRVDVHSFVPTVAELQRRAEKAAMGGAFTGGPVERYAATGQMQFDVLLNAGVQPHHRVVDIGAGALRLGYWLMNYLAPGRYCALEPSDAMIETGRRIVGPELLERARPTFDSNDRFDLDAFGACDFGLARSVWTHTSMHQIDLLLGAWAKHGTGPLFASYLPADKRREAYRGNSWVGISHESDTPGLVRHRLRDISKHAKKHGLHVTEIDEPIMGKQIWLRISR